MLFDFMFRIQLDLSFQILIFFEIELIRIKIRIGFDKVQWHYSFLRLSNIISSKYFVRTCHRFLVYTICTLLQHWHQCWKCSRVGRIRNLFRSQIRNCWNPRYRISYNLHIWTHPIWKVTFASTLLAIGNMRLMTVIFETFLAFGACTYPNSSMAIGKTAPMSTKSSTTFDHIFDSVGPNW